MQHILSFSSAFGGFHHLFHTKTHSRVAWLAIYCLLKKSFFFRFLVDLKFKVILNVWVILTHSQ